MYGVAQMGAQNVHIKKTQGQIQRHAHTQRKHQIWGKSVVK